jgi:carboxymethylenebutenolidase
VHLHCRLSRAKQRPRKELLAQINRRRIQYVSREQKPEVRQINYEAALKANEFEMHTYPGTLHGFHNNLTPRYNPEAADLAWQRTIAFFSEHLNS